MSSLLVSSSLGTQLPGASLQRSPVMHEAALTEAPGRLLAARTPVDFLASPVRRRPPSVPGSAPAYNDFFFQVRIGHFLVFKMLFSWPFVSFTTGSCLGLQSSAPHILSGQMEMLIPQATLATHSSCFRSSKASGSYLQEYILPGLLLVLNIGCPQ